MLDEIALAARAINAIRAAGSIPAAVANGVLTRGIMHRAVVEGVPFVLAGSLRDDGPLPDVITDMNRAQEEQIRALRAELDELKRLRR